MKQYIKNSDKTKEYSSLYDAFKGKDSETLSLYDVFKLGDRVKRRYKDDSGRSREYTGIVLAIDKDNVEVYWDTLDGKYMPKEMDVAFTNCSKDDIFKGSEYYTPIRRE